VALADTADKIVLAATLYLPFLPSLTRRRLTRLNSHMSAHDFAWHDCHRVPGNRLSPAYTVVRRVEITALSLIRNVAQCHVGIIESELTRDG